MAICRLAYLVALGGALAFFICFNGYFSIYVLALALLFPLLSLLVSLPGMLGLGVGLTCDAATVRRHGAAGVTLRLQSRWRLPVARVDLRLICENRLTGERRTLRKRAAGGSAGLRVPVELAAQHCGVLEWRVTRVRVCDLLGLFALRRPLPPPASVLVLPLDLESEHVPSLRGAEERNQVLKPRPGGGPGEDYDLRPYRPGDPLRAVHWKLSSKLDELVVRETLEPVKTAVVLTYDHFGPRDKLDGTLDRLDAVSRALIEREIPHYIQWIGPEDLRRSCLVTSLRELRAFQWEAFALPAPAEGRSLSGETPTVEGIDGIIRHLHVTAQEQVGGEEG